MRFLNVTRVNLSALSFVTFLCFATPSCILFDEYRTCPTAFEGEDARRKFESLRKGLSVTGIRFFNEKIYLSTSKAILEFNGERLDRLYKCRRADWDVFEPVGTDRISQKLWFYNYRDHQLLQLGGANWSSQDIPPLTKPDYYSREDVNVGFVGFDYNGEFLLLNKSRFSMANQQRAWIYGGEKKWTAIELPWMDCSFGNSERVIAKGCLIELGPVENELCAVLNGDLIGQNVAKGKPVLEEFLPQTDIVACKSGSSWRVLNPQGTPEFFSDKVVSRYNAMYASTSDGNIFRITTAGPESIPTLGKVDAISVSSEGNLLVWFARQGIYEWRGEWKKLYDSPFESDSNLQGKLIEESGGTIVITASPVRDPDDTLPDQAWIMKDGRVVQIL